jgi:transcriptional regulator
VPTWNYVAVHAYGTLQLIDDREELLGLLHRSIRFFEASRPRPWSLDFEGERLDVLLRSIVGFRIAITRLEGKWKLSQNHPEQRRWNVVRALSGQGGDDSSKIAALMRQSLTGTDEPPGQETPE